MAKTVRRGRKSIQVRVGERLRDLRERATLTQAELARRAGLAKSFVAQVERGGQAPSIASLERLTLALHVPLLALFDAEPTPPPPPKDERVFASIANDLRKRDVEFLLAVRYLIRSLDSVMSKREKHR